MRSLRPDLQRLDRVQLQHRSPDLSDSDQIPECSISAHRRSVTWLQPAWVWPRAGRRVPRAQVPLTSPRAQAAYRPREAAKWCETTSSVEYRKPIHGLGFQAFPLVSEVRRSGLLIRVSWVRVPPPEPPGNPYCVWVIRPLGSRLGAVYRCRGPPLVRLAADSIGNRGLRRACRIHQETGARRSRTSLRLTHDLVAA